MPLTGEDKAAAIEKYKDLKPEERKGLFGRLSRAIGNLFGSGDEVEQVNVSRTTVVLWPWIIEKAYAVLGGGYDSIGKGGYSLTPTLALMGQDTKAYNTEVSRRDQIVEDMNEEEASLVFDEARALIFRGGIVTVSTRSSEQVQARSDFIDSWRVSAATSQGITVDIDGGKFMSWSSLDRSLHPFIQVETGDGSLHSVDPQAITDEDKSILIEAVQAGRFVEVRSKAHMRNDGLQLVPRHVYTVDRAHRSGIRIHNPWGGFQPGRMIRPHEFAKYFHRINMSETPGPDRD